MLATATAREDWWEARVERAAAWKAQAGRVAARAAAVTVTVAVGREEARVAAKAAVARAAAAKAAVAVAAAAWAAARVAAARAAARVAAARVAATPMPRTGWPRKPPASSKGGFRSAS